MQLGHMLDSFSVFSGFLTLFFGVDGPVCNPTNSKWGFSFPSILPSICCWWLFLLILKILTGIQWNHKLVLICIFLVCFLAMSSLGHSLFRSQVRVLNRSFVLWLCFFEFLTYSGYYSSVQNISGKDTLIFWGLPLVNFWSQFLNKWGLIQKFLFYTYIL